MKILYGVAREGRGDAARSRALLEHLARRGHQVVVAAPTRNHVLLRDLPPAIGSYFDRATRFRATAVISDFDSWSWLYAFEQRLPLLSIDSMQVVDRCDLPDDVRNRRGVRLHVHVARALRRSKLPLCDRYFIPTVFCARLQTSRLRLVPPIVRKEILAMASRRRRGAHVVVSIEAGGDREILAAVRAAGIEARVHHAGPSERGDDAGFVHDLATCRAVISSGGATLMGEALYLKKPMLAFPSVGRFDRLLEAQYLDLEGFGAYATRPDARAVRGFLDRLPAFEDNLADYEQDGNREILEGLDDWLADAAAKRARRTDVVDKAA